MSDDPDIVVDFSLVKRAVPTLVVDNYERVLHYIDRAIASKRIHSSGLKLIYLSSHPELCVPDVPLSELKTKSGIDFKKLGRRDWILPLVYSGLIDFVLWQHPIWSGQILDRQPTEYLVGEDKETGKLCVNIPEEYFCREGAFCHADNMKSAKKFTLMVAPIHETNTLCRVCENILCQCINKPFLFIIDLTSSSTVNPLKDRFTAEQFKIIDHLFVQTPPITISIPPEELTSAAVIEHRGMLAADILNSARRRQLSRLRYWIQLLGTGKPITSPEVIALWPQELFDLCELVLSVKSTEPALVEITPASVKAIEETMALAKKRLTESGQDPPPVALASGEETVRRTIEELGLEAKDTTTLFPSSKVIENPGPLDGLYKLWLDSSEDLEIPPMDDEEDLMVEVPKTEEELEAEKGMKKYPPFIRSWHPHYVSTKEQQEQLCDDQETLMNRLHNPGLMFTVTSESSGRIPKDQIEDILFDQLLGLTRIYGPKILAVALDYPNPEGMAKKLKDRKINVETIAESLHRIENPPWPVKNKPPANDGDQTSSN